MNLQENIANVKTAVDQPPTAKSLHDTLHKDGSYTFDNTTDSLEAIADALATTDALVDTVIRTTPITLDRATDTLPQTAAEGIFTVTGRVIITQIIGEVTTIIQAQANNFKLISNPTVGADVDLCAVVEINADAAGTLYNITGTLADAMVPTTSGAFPAQAAAVIVTAGTIDWSTSASSTGNVKWTIHYIPLEAGASVAIVAV